MSPSIDRAIIQQPEFFPMRDGIHETVRSILLTYSADLPTATMQFGAIFGFDPDLWIAAAYGSIKNDFTVEEASLVLLLFYLMLRANEVTKDKLPVRFLLDRNTKAELKRLEAISDAIGPRCELIRTGPERTRFMQDVTLYLMD